MREVFGRPGLAYPRRRRSVREVALLSHHAPYGQQMRVVFSQHCWVYFWGWGRALARALRGTGRHLGVRLKR